MTYFKTIRATGAGLALLAAAACSTTSGSDENPGEVAGASNAMTAFETLAGRVNGTPGSKFDAVQALIDAEGSAVFVGSGMVEVSGDDGAVLTGVGDVTVNVAFATSEISGGLTNITGYEGTAAEVAAAAAAEDDLAAIAGSLSLSRGDIFEARLNRFGVDYDGTVGAAGYAIEGRAIGQFNGTRERDGVFPLRSVSIDHNEGTATVGEDSFSVEVSLVGEAGE